MVDTVVEVPPTLLLTLTSTKAQDHSGTEDAGSIVGKVYAGRLQIRAARFGRKHVLDDPRAPGTASSSMEWL